MSRMSELIYPDAPGFKVAGPSQLAAEKVAPTSNKIRADDEIATCLNLSVLSVRPRVSELHRLGTIERTGSRRTNESGMTATVWPLTPELPAGEGV